MCRQPHDLCFIGCVPHYKTIKTRFDSTVRVILENYFQEKYEEQTPHKEVDQMTLGQAYTVLRSIAKTDDTGKTCRGISVLQDLMQPGCDPFPSSFYKIGEFLENQKQQLAACPNLDGGVVVPLQTMSYFARFTDGWEMDDRKEPMLPETSWKAYCGFSNSELHNLQLEIGDRCTYYEKVKLTKKEKKLVC